MLGYKCLQIVWLNNGFILVQFKGCFTALFLTILMSFNSYLPKHGQIAPVVLHARGTTPA